MNLNLVICPIVEIHTLDSKSGTSAENYEQVIKWFWKS